MREILTVNPKVPLYNKDIRVVEWTHGDPFPEMGPSVGVDTETELITDSVLFPPVVVLGCFDGQNQICYIVHWQDIPEFMHELCSRDIQQRYFNLGFDEGVIDNEDPDKALIEAIDAGRVRDMQIRIHLQDIAEKGWIPQTENSLAGCSKKYLGLVLDKGDGTESSARLSFRRDREITEEQYRYLPFDCISTWMLGEAVHEAPVDPNTGRSIEIVHTQGMVALAHIRANGFPVDMRIFNALEARLKADYQASRQKIVGYGFPDPDYDPKEEAALVSSEYVSGMQRLTGTSDEFPMPNKNTIKVITVLMHGISGESNPDMIQDALSQLHDMAMIGVSSLRKKPAQAWMEIAEDYSLEAFDKTHRAIVMQAFISRFVSILAGQLSSDAFSAFDIEAAIRGASSYVDDHPYWMLDTKPIGPRKFFQEHVAKLLTDHPGLRLDRTPKSGEYKLTKKDLWRLEDAGVRDPFLTEYAALQHTDKYLSTYLNREFIASDGKIHARYTSLVRTGRTSASSPSVQNFPSHDSTYQLKNYFCAPPGTILCATDYSFVELVNLAESCIQRFGKSSMADVINAGVDPHRWFAGVRDGLITNDTSFIKDPQKVAEMKAYLKENITPEQRQHSKAANFGFPGGLKPFAFMKNCRENGMQMTEQHAAELRTAWISAFPEMERHFAIQPKTQMQELKIQMGFTAPTGMVGGIRMPTDGGDADEDGDVESAPPDPGRDTYEATLTNGMIRTKCSYNSALNIQFQGLAAYGAKCGLWNLIMAGFSARLCCFIHDEIVYWLYPDELDTLIPVVEQCMIEGMRIATPHVKVGVETCCMLHWDKHAEEFTKLKKDDNGNYIIPEPPYVREVLGLEG